MISLIVWNIKLIETETAWGAGDRMGDCGQKVQTSNYKINKF